MRDDQEHVLSETFDDDSANDDVEQLVAADVVDAERDYMEHRREINRRSARKQRQKQLQLVFDVRKAYYSAQSANTELVYTVRQLQRQRDRLRETWDAHRSVCNRLVNQLRPDDEPVPVDDDIASASSILDPDKCFVRRSPDDVIVADRSEDNYSPIGRRSPDPPISERLSREDAALVARSSVRRLETVVGAGDIAAWSADQKSRELIRMPDIAVGRRRVVRTIPRYTDYRRPETDNSPLSPTTRRLTRGSSLNVKETSTMAAMRPRLLARRSVSLNACSTSTTTLTKPRLSTTFSASATDSETDSPSLKASTSEVDGRPGNSASPGVTKRSPLSKNVVTPRSILAGKSPRTTTTTQIDGCLQWTLLPKSVLDAMTAAESEDSPIDEVTPITSTRSIEHSSWNRGSARTESGEAPLGDGCGLKYHPTNRNDKSGCGEESIGVVASRTARIQSASDAIVVPTDTRGQHQRGAVDDLPTLICKSLTFDDDSGQLNRNLSEYCADDFITESLQLATINAQLPQQHTSLEHCNSWDSLMLGDGGDYFGADPSFDCFLADENHDP